jgi:hypothetical protein
VTSYGPDNCGQILFPCRDFFVFATASRPAPYRMCIRGSFPGIKQPQRESNCSPPCSDEFKMRSATRVQGMALTSGQGQFNLYKGVTKSFRTGRLERELQMVQLSATRCSCIAILWVSLVGFAAITLCVASQRVFVFVVVHLVIDSVRKLLDTPPYAFRLSPAIIWTLDREALGHKRKKFLNI